MTSGEPSPWGPRAPEAAPDPYAAGYAGPWMGPVGAPGPSAPWDPPPPWPPSAPDHVTDDQLRRLPPPVPGPQPARSATAGAQRPAVLGLAVTLSVTASLLWVCGLSLFLVVALVGTQAMASTGDRGYVFHTLDETVLRMGDGLWLPLYGFPVAALVSGFLLLAGRPWTRVVHTAVGVATLGWAGWWLRGSLLLWFVVAAYVVTAVAVLWVPSVGRWYATRPRRGRTDDAVLTG